MLLLCQELGKQLHELMGWDGPMTERQRAAWIAWLMYRRERQMEQVNQQQRGGSSPQGAGPPGREPRSKEEAALFAKARWGAALGIGHDPELAKRAMAGVVRKEGQVK